MIQLRDYQVDMINRVRESLRGNQRVILQAPTGAGKTKPESAQIWYPGVTTRQNLNGIEEIKQKVANWYEYANKNPKKSISDEFLSRRIVAISEQNEERGNTIKIAKDLAEQLLKTLEGAQ